MHVDKIGAALIIALGQQAPTLLNWNKLHE